MFEITNCEVRYIRDSISGFKFGNTIINSLLQAVIKITISDGNRFTDGYGQAGLCPPWNDKSPARSNISLSEKENEMKKIISFTIGKYKNSTFNTPLELYDNLISEITDFSFSVNPENPVPPLMIMNSVSAVDLALWETYARFKEKNVFEVIPEDFKNYFSGDHKQVIVLHTVGGTDSLDSIQEAINKEGICAFKIKLGGDPDWNKQRIKDIHSRFGNMDTESSIFNDGKISYTFDLNEQCRDSEDLFRLVDFLDKTGIAGRTILIEEPFFRDNYSARVDNPGIDMEADERLVSVEDVVRVFELGYKRIAIKPSARTFSESLKMVIKGLELGMKPGVMDLTNGVPFAFPAGVLTASKLPQYGSELPFLETNGRQYYDWAGLAGLRVTENERNIFYTSKGYVDSAKLMKNPGFGILPNEYMQKLFEERSSF